MFFEHIRHQAAWSFNMYMRQRSFRTSAMFKVCQTSQKMVKLK